MCAFLSFFHFLNENMKNQISLKDTLDPIIQNPETTLETLLKSDSFLLYLKNSADQLNLIDFLCKDDNPYKILKYALMSSMDIEDFKTIHSYCITILTSSYFNDRSLRTRFIKNSKFIECLVNFPESDFLQNNFICANYSKIIEFFLCHLSKFPNEQKIIKDNFGFLQNFLLNNINILPFRELSIKLILSYPDLINRSSDMFINMIEFNLADQNKLFFALHSIIHVLSEKPSLDSLIDNENFGNLILKVGIDNYDSNPLISTQAFKIFEHIKERSTQPNFQNIIKSTDFIFTSVNTATTNALQLFPNNIENFIIPFFEFKCTTFLNDTIVIIFRSLKKQEMSDIITKYHINNLIMKSFENYILSKTNGHFFELTKIISDSKTICCTEHETDWNLFILQKLNSRKQQVNKKTETKISNEKKFFHLSMFKQNMRPRK